MIGFTKPFLPPMDLYTKKIEKIWQNSWLTNNGPVLKELERRVAAYLGLSRFSYVSNGTIALQLAIKALDISGEVITTPFSYVATTSALVWETCCPVFVDIDAETLNIDPAKVEAAITKNTEAILVTHVFGNPAEVLLLQEIAERNNLKLIYDAAHCFGVKFNKKSIFEFGDISILSTHATKIFHTTEGGFVSARDNDVIRKVNLMKNFGHDGPEQFSIVGVNGKNSEFHAAMGLCNLEFIDVILERRKKQYNYYLSLLADSRKLRFQKINSNATYNYSYLPVVFDSEATMLAVQKKLINEDIVPRRYFYPSLNTLNYVKYDHMPVSEEIARSILCLPLSHDLTEEEIELVVNAVLEAVG